MQRSCCVLWLTGPHAEIVGPRPLVTHLRTCTIPSVHSSGSWRSFQTSGVPFAPRNVHLLCQQYLKASVELLANGQSGEKASSCGEGFPSRLIAAHAPRQRCRSVLLNHRQRVEARPVRGEPRWVPQHRQASSSALLALAAPHLWLVPVPASLQRRSGSGRRATALLAAPSSPLTLGLHPLIPGLSLFALQLLASCRRAAACWAASAAVAAAAPTP